MLPTDHALLRDPKLRAYAEKYASDSKSFFADFAAAWEKLLELGCTRLAPHPASLTYASSCVVPCEWLELPLRTRRDHTHDTAEYGFGLPEPTQTLRQVAGWAREWLVIRLPVGSEGFFETKHRKSVTCDTKKEMPVLGFALERDEQGPRGERVHYWKRVA